MTLNRCNGFGSKIATAGVAAAFALLGTSCSLPVPEVAGAAPADATASSYQTVVTPAAAAGYLGTSLPTTAVLFPASFWTTPIGSAPALGADSAGQIAMLRHALADVLGYQPTLQVNIVRYSAPVHVVDRRTSPIVDIPCDSALPMSLDPDQDRVAEGIPVPDGLWADPSDDSHMIIVDQGNWIAYEFWNWRQEGPRQYRAGMMGKWSLAGKGWNASGTDLFRVRNGATASKVPYIGGLVRYEEVAAGEIRHALHMVVPTTRAGQFQAPAVSTDGRYSGSAFIPEGARVQLNPALNLNTLGLTPPSRVIARALQVYGAYVTDTAGGWAIKLQNLGPDGGAWRQLGYQISLQSIPLEQFRVLK